MKPGDTVITPGGKEGKIGLIVPPSEWFADSLIYVDFEKPNPHYLIYLESEVKEWVKVKEEKKKNML